MSIHSVILPVHVNIAQSLIGDWERITVVDQKGLSGFPTIKYPMKMK